MFRLSKAAEYAGRGLLYLAKSPGKEISIEEISKSRAVPAAYLAKLFQSLARKGFVRSHRGAEGGFTLAKPPSEVTLLEIIEAIEGPIFLNDCLIHKGYCPMDDVCPIHDVWRRAQLMFLEHLRATTLSALAAASEVKEKKARERLKAVSAAAPRRKAGG